MEVSVGDFPKEKDHNYSKVKNSDFPEYDISTLQSSVSEVDGRQNSKCSKCWKVFMSLRIEPVMFLFMFSFILNTTCLTNMMMDKGCLFYFNFTKEICDNMSAYKNERDEVEILANNYNIYLNFLTPVGAFVVIFLTPWSDKYGRKPLLLLALFGFLANDIGIILCTVYFDSPLYFILISNLPTQLSGGFTCIMTIIYSHVSEVSTPESRSLKYTILQIAFELSVTIGALIGGQVFKHYHYLGVYYIMTAGHGIAILWVILLVPETRGLETKVPFHKKCKDLISSQNFTDGFRTCWKSRENQGKETLWMLLLSSCTIALTYKVYTDITYVYTHHMYHWDPTIYSLMWTMFSFSEMLVFLILTPILIRHFILSDPVIGIIGTISLVCKSVFLAFAYKLWLYYLSNISGFLNGLGNLAIRSLISKLIPDEESGRVFSFLAICEAIVPMLGSAVITKTFNAAIKVFPGVCFLAVTVFLVLPLGIFMTSLTFFITNDVFDNASSKETS